MRCSRNGLPRRAKNFTQIDDRLYIKYGYKKSPTYIEQINRLPCEVGYYHFLNAAKICTIFETTKLFQRFFQATLKTTKSRPHSHADGSTNNINLKKRSPILSVFVQWFSAALVPHFLSVLL